MTAAAPWLDRLLAGAVDTLALLEDDDAGGVRRTSGRALLARAQALAARLRGAGPPLDGAAVAFLFPPGAAYVEALLGICLAGGTAVPLSPLHTPAELAHALATARPRAVLAAPALRGRLPALPPGTALLPGEGPPEAPAPPLALPAAAAPALMLFTSGTTGKPKGVVTSHAALGATCAALQEAWRVDARDRLLHVLPLHHTHGVVVALLTALTAGAEVRFAAFEAGRVLRLLAEATVFMAVPTIHAKLVEHHAAAPTHERQAAERALGGLRLCTSGSAALPPALFHAIAGLSGGRPPLERYGMTEIGMALSNPLDGPRLPGAVGRPLPGVEVDLVADDGRPCAPGQPGELRVRTPQMFSGYHGDPAATAAAFDEDGRFRTGDTGVRDEAGVVRLLGRTSVDILKSGGYKLSALEIEEVLREHPAIAEVAVIGRPDATWGDRVTACVVLRPGERLTLEELQAFARDRLAPYKLPRELHVLAELPRNALGKLQKGVLRERIG